LLEDRPEAKARGYKYPDVDSLKKWAAEETKLGNPALEKAVAKTDDEVLKRALKWSYAVNDTVAKIVRGVPPFPYVRESLEVAFNDCDMLVVSATPCEALEREWKENDISKYVRVIGGQEMGTKKQILQEVNHDNKYDLDKCLMIGDAPGDLKSAKVNGMLFYPINPGDEENSWKRFYNESYRKFIEGTYAGDYETMLIKEFDRYLPDTPPWKK
jgi:phosphoglycolate phosphatase-like HAD superfamily hydrolase